MNVDYKLPLLMTLLAGLSTVIGGFLTFFIKRTNIKALSVGLGFSAGVMIFLSFTQIIKTANDMLHKFFPHHSQWVVFAGFGLGILVALIIDYFIPDHLDNDLFNDKEHCTNCSHRIKRAGLFTAIAISVHNFPEGMTTFFVGTQNLALGASVALAIAIHNIPEGIAVALPIYHATGKKTSCNLVHVSFRDFRADWGVNRACCTSLFLTARSNRTFVRSSCGNYGLLVI